MTRCGFAAQDPLPWAGAVNVPTLVYQVRDDSLVAPDDVQSMLDAFPTAQKRLHWIDASARRWGRCLEFQRNPKPMLDWLDRHTA
jgi:pimeloyl-ACP methyl ester carboxylesterase